MNLGISFNRLQLRVCECAVGVDVGDETTNHLNSIPSNVVMGCIVSGRQMNVYLGTIVCTNTITFVGIDVRVCTMKIHDSMIKCPQTMSSIVVHLAVVHSLNRKLHNDHYP